MCDALRVAVLAGGTSHERPVSLWSGTAVDEALRMAGHYVEVFDPAQMSICRIPWQRFDVCFIALHGGEGEDGRIQRELSDLGVPYTGSGPTASRLALHKSAAKERFLQSGVPTPPYVLLHVDDAVAVVCDRILELGFPIVIKPDSLGSSLGVFQVASEASIGGALAGVRKFDSFAIAERWIEGREFTVALLDRQVLPPIEIFTPHAFFDYAAKYEAVTTEYRFEFRLGADARERLQEVAVRAADALGTRGLCRVDLRLDAADEPWVLEVNTVPGMTSHSLAPLAAAQAGLDMPALCDHLVRACLAEEALA